MERLPNRKRPIRRGLGKIGTASLAIAAIVFGTGSVEVATGAVSKTAGKLVQTAVGWDNRGFNATSGGIPAQNLSELMKLRDQRDRDQVVQTALDQAESEALRQKLNPGPKQFP